MKNLKAIIFDMDGLLIDSMKYWLDIDREMFEKMGIELTNDFIRSVTGKSIKETNVWMEKKYGETAAKAMYVRSDDRIKKIYTESTEVMPGADSLIRTVAKSDLKQAIATGASSAMIDIVVDRFNWRECFDDLVSADHVNHVGKPDPAIFLQAARELGVFPEECVVFEDAENGVVAAKCAGMHCVAVPNKNWSPGDFSSADLIAKSLEDNKIFKFIGI